MRQFAALLIVLAVILLLPRPLVAVAPDNPVQPVDEPRLRIWPVREYYASTTDFTARIGDWAYPQGAITLNLICEGPQRYPIKLTHTNPQVQFFYIPQSIGCNEWGYIDVVFTPKESGLIYDYVTIIREIKTADWERRAERTSGVLDRGPGTGIFAEAYSL